MKKIKTFSIVLMMVISALSFTLIPLSTGTVATELPDYEPIDFGTEIRNAHYELDTNIPIMSARSSSSGPNSAGSVGDLMYYLIFDSYFGYSFDVFECRAVGDVAEVWVQLDLSYPEGDPRETPIITDEQVNYLLEEFDTNIYPIDTQYFGTPDYHDGSYSLLEAWGYFPPGYYYEGEGKNLILVSNVRDDAYYDPTYPYYIAGFYSPTFEAYFDRNIISIDSHDWLNRVGPDGSRPNLYESVIAHEYQHLIHDDYNPNDDTFMNEGCSMYAEPLCGYALDWGAIESFLATPDNSLTLWGDQGDINILADYGCAMAWTIYLSDQYGGADFISHFVQAGIPGIDGVNAALEYFGYTDTFDDAFHNWRIANLIHSGDGKYNYHSIDLNDAEVEVRNYLIDDIPFDEMLGSDFGTTTTILGYDTEISLLGTYSSDYIRMYDDHFRPSWNTLFFDGDDNAYPTNSWTFTESGWYSGAANLLNDMISANVYVDPLDPTLYLSTYWDIEDYWDFGFVQVSTDDGATWTSLENEYTTYDYDPSAHPDAVANLPGLTGWSGDFVDMTFDLSAYVGQDVMIGFRYVTDWATTYEGWYIADANVGGNPLDLGLFYPPYPADFMVTLVVVKEVGWGNRYQVYDVSLSDLTNEGAMRLKTAWADYVILIVSPIMEKGLIDYSFKVEAVHPGHYYGFF
ncbi:MAG: hypothetical protein ACTSVK_03100 [Promethearchaeota archaeon]